MNFGLVRTSARLLAVATSLSCAADLERSNSRQPKSEADLRFWLENMVWYHRFSTAEIKTATGLSKEEIVPHSALRIRKSSESSDVCRLRMRPGRPIGPTQEVIGFLVANHLPLRRVPRQASAKL